MADENETTATVEEEEGEHRGDALNAVAAAGTPRRSGMSNLVARLSTGGTQTTTRKFTPPLTVPLLDDVPASDTLSQPSGHILAHVGTPSRDVESGFESKAYVVVDRRNNRLWRASRVLLLLLVILLNDAVTGVLAAYLSRTLMFEQWLVRRVASTGQFGRLADAAHRRGSAFRPAAPQLPAKVSLCGCGFPVGGGPCNAFFFAPDTASSQSADGIGAIKKPLGIHVPNCSPPVNGSTVVPPGTVVAGADGLLCVSR